MPDHDAAVQDVLYDPSAGYERAENRRGWGGVLYSYLYSLCKGNRVASGIFWEGFRQIIF